MKIKLFRIKILAIIFICYIPLTAQTDSVVSYTEYICPMYCSEYFSTEPDRCPVCKMNLEAKVIIENPTDYRLIRTVELKKLLESKEAYLLLDVRSEREFNSDLKPFEGAVSIPINELKNRMDELEEYKNGKIIVYCSHGIRSARGAKLLLENEYDAYSLLGGLVKWNREIQVK